MKLSFNILIKISILVLMQLQGLAWASMKSIREMENYREFNVKLKDSMHLMGFSVGPKEGVPIILVGGIASNVSYYVTLTQQLVRQGFKVYAYNHRGHGQREMHSTFTEDGDLDRTFFEYLVSDFRVVLKKVSQENSRKAVVVGHSLGGLILRAAETGLTLKNKTPTFDARLNESFRKQVAFKALVASPTPLPNGFTEDDEVNYEQKLRSNIFERIKQYSVMAKLNQNYNYFIDGLLNVPITPRLFKKALSWFGSAEQKQTLDFSLITFEEFKTLILEGGSIEPPHMLLKQLDHWLHTREIYFKKNYKQANLTEKYADTDIKRVPTLYVVAKGDYLTPKLPSQYEVQHLETTSGAARLLVLPGGHINPILGNNAKKLAEEIHLFKLDALLACVNTLVERKEGQ